jgi:short-subunit dehydrogenase
LEPSSASVSFIIGGSTGMVLETARLLIANGGTFVLVGRDHAKLAARKRELENGSKGKVERSRPIYMIRKLWKP